jgi:hypothetical protein
MNIEVAIALLSASLPLTALIAKYRTSGEKVTVREIATMSADIASIKRDICRIFDKFDTLT